MQQSLQFQQSIEFRAVLSHVGEIDGYRWRLFCFEAVGEIGDAFSGQGVLELQQKVEASDTGIEILADQVRYLADSVRDVWNILLAGQRLEGSRTVPALTPENAEVVIERFDSGDWNVRFRKPTSDENLSSA